MRFLLGLLMLVISGSALATIDVMQFKDEAQEQQFRQLTEQLRCPKCQNNSIAEISIFPMIKSYQKILVECRVIFMFQAFLQGFII